VKIIGLMLARNEQWVIGSSAKAALRWVDKLVVLDHASADGTRTKLIELAQCNPGRVHILSRDDSQWLEMDHRQATLVEGRRHGGTHFAIIDADEILTANQLDSIRASNVYDATYPM